MMTPDDWARAKEIVDAATGHSGGDNVQAAEEIFKPLYAAGFVLMLGWQPIGTAPKDGTLVLVTDADIMEVAKNYGDGWMSGDGLDFGYGAWDDKLTHWMPRPEPPST